MSVVSLHEYRVRKSVPAQLLQDHVVEVPREFYSWNDERTLKDVITAVGCRAQAKQVFFSWVNLHQATLKLCAQVTHHYPGETESLLIETVRAAMLAYEDARGASSSEVAPMVTYLNKLLEASAGILSYRAVGEKADGCHETWQPFKTPLQVWVRKHRVQSIRFSRTSDFELIKGDARAMLANEILDLRDVMLLKDWEEAV